MESTSTVEDKYPESCILHIGFQPGPYLIHHIILWFARTTKGSVCLGGQWALRVFL